MSKRFQCASHSVCCIRSEHEMQVTDIQTTQQAFFTSTQSHCIAPKMTTLRNMSTLSKRKKRLLTSSGVTACMRPRLPRLTAGFMTDRTIRVASGLHRRNGQRIEHTHICVSLVAQHARNRHTLARGTARTQPTHTRSWHSTHATNTHCRHQHVTVESQRWHS